MKILSTAMVLMLALIFIACTSTTTTTKTETKEEPGMITTPSGLQYQDIVAGTGTEAKTGNKVKVHYVGTLTDGTKFDSSVDRGQPFDFDLGAGRVIKGWDEGVAGMKVGGKRKLVIPPELGYGGRAIGKIPANSTLIFEVELLDVK
ncbi:MAG: peptidylprolyl isomerase [Ignavibacteria bacterium GWB2_35_12]|nr:MAG: peptidylprolyl isomerase [Ignavibacteria bacterium GWA2_35_8]OGU40968.1 MAG: peptidylprolyl isomerase [Ignavibacteria bacterium GWB2_35_12]OGU92568.1 MAG: peptidylprolyl isomerase [Ignavibacteria bacterium RIFOXYA2_FULL_35_10]OGV19744.1 MAG: peptidylprolyl isomerase [Ignavibacteria bacterium RIFOXYC2_FULL_35_21]